MWVLVGDDNACDPAPVRAVVISGSSWVGEAPFGSRQDLKRGDDGFQLLLRPDTYQALPLVGG